MKDTIYNSLTLLLLSKVNKYQKNIFLIYKKGAYPIIDEFANEATSFAQVTKYMT